MKEKNIGIISMQRIANYGSFLQAYALKKVIESFGYNVVFIDYKIGSPIITDRFERKKFKKMVFVRFVRRILVKLSFLSFLFPASVKHTITFNVAFKKDSKKYLGISSAKIYDSNVDLLVIGSDEVFNCTQLNPDVGFSPSLFGKGTSAKRIVTYAASFGNTTLDKINNFGKAEEISSYLRNMSYVSVRDINSRNIVYSLIEKLPTVNVDPVLLYDFSGEFNKKISLSDFIVVYAYRGRITKEEETIIRSFAHQEKKIIVCIGGFQKFADINVSCSPSEMLAYFKKTDYVFTDTFHGSIFAIINHKQFVTFVRESKEHSYGNSEKLGDLLLKLNLNERSVTSKMNVASILKTPINYDIVDRIIDSERKKSFDYLKVVLSENIDQ